MELINPIKVEVNQLNPKLKYVSIDQLVYLIKQAKINNEPKPIIFLGAGASKTGGIPLAKEIIEDILKDHNENPAINSLKLEDRNYMNVMGCLTGMQRNQLLKGYIEKAKINITHIYLAQLIVNGYIDYVLTVNFDNLMLRALALFNEFPPTYDLAILKDFTTTAFKEKSIIYLHGQHHGMWLLNTQEELNKIKDRIDPILHSIKNQRTWIFLGYSGDDPTFEYITKLGCFDNNLYWIPFRNDVPIIKVCESLLEKENTNAYIINDYDSDSFMLKLNHELNLPEPLIIDKPFTSLKNSLNNIVDISELITYPGVKVRLEIAKNDVNKAISQFESGEINDNDFSLVEFKINALKKRIIALIINEKFINEEIDEIESLVLKINDKSLITTFSDLYNAWGIYLANKAKIDNNVILFEESYNRYSNAIKFDSQNYAAYFNWGASMSHLAKANSDVENLKLSLEKYKAATIINQTYFPAFYNWGTGLSSLGRLTKDSNYFIQSFEKYKRAIDLEPNDENAYLNWASSLADLANLTNNIEFFKTALNKFEHVISINPKSDQAYINWGTTLLDIARLTKDVKYYNESLEKFEFAENINNVSEDLYNNWGTVLSEYADIQKSSVLFEEAISKFNKALFLNPNSIFANLNLAISTLNFGKLLKDEDILRKSLLYFQKVIDLDSNNYSAYVSWGAGLGILADMLNSRVLFLDAISKYEKSISLNNNLILGYLNWGRALFLLGKLDKDEDLIEESFRKFEIANNIEITGPILSIWGTALCYLAKLRNDSNLFFESENKLTKSIELGELKYNLACLFAMKGEKNKALGVLKESLEKNEIERSFVLKDSDWNDLKSDEDFLELIQRFS